MTHACRTRRGEEEKEFIVTLKAAEATRDSFFKNQNRRVSWGSKWTVKLKGKLRAVNTISWRPKASKS